MKASNEADPVSFSIWRAKVAELAAQLYGRTLDGLDEELSAGFAVGDTPAEFCAGVFTN